MAAKPQEALREYRAKRRFDRTPEPRGKAAARTGKRFVIQKHAARRLHYDFRLELDGVLKSWAVTRGPSLDPAVKRLAVRTEDHPVEYAGFEGRIPEGYGAGTVMLWDQGEWEPIGDPRLGIEKGKLAFHLDGDRLKGRWALVRFQRQSSKRENWLLIKERDEFADRETEITAAETASVASGRDLEAIADAPEAVWHSTKPTGASGRRSGVPPGSQPLPQFDAPALATLVDDVPQGDGWLFEIKFDGYRALAAAAGKAVRIYTRSGLDWTDRYPPIATAIAALDLPGALLDGEIVVVDDAGRSDFSSLQDTLKTGGGALSYFVFDLLAENGRSIRDKPLVERKARLKALLGAPGRKGPVFYTDHVERDGKAFFDALCGKGFEGIIAKQATAPYRGGRGRSWLKVKCGKRQEFVVVGFSPSTRDRPFSSVLLGLHENGVLRYAGRVGTGFCERDLNTLAGRFRPVDEPVVGEGVPRAVARSATWVRPDLVAEIGFAGFTADGLVRQGHFLGLREDKEADAVVRERPQHLREATRTPARPKADKPAPVEQEMRLTHPDKVLFPEQGISKRDLADYLAAVAPRMLPHVVNRPITLVRCPEGRHRSCFYQRHAGQGLPPQFRELPLTEQQSTPKRYIYIDGSDGLQAAAQFGVLEIHIWGTHVDHVERPDRIVFDLDPDPSVPFAAVRTGAKRVRDVLDALGLQSFAMLTGGKGIHVVAPIVPKHDWAVVKEFTRAVATRIVDDDPDRYVATMTKAKRRGRIFVDFFRNDRTATAIAPYSTRKHPGAPIAWPIGWRALDRAGAADDVTVSKARRLLSRADPWKDYAAVRQSLKASAFTALGL